MQQPTLRGRGETAEILRRFFLFFKTPLGSFGQGDSKTDILKYRVLQFFTRISQIVIRRKCKGDQEKLKKLLDACQKPLEAWSTHQKGRDIRHKLCIRWHAHKCTIIWRYDTIISRYQADIKRSKENPPKHL